jgi:glucose-1-phosphate thymidylyltransferase
MVAKGVIVVEDGGCDVVVGRPDRTDALKHVANRPIAHHVLDALEVAGVTEIVVASSADVAAEVRDCLAERELDAGARIQYVETAAPLDLPSALRLAAPLIEDAPCIVHLASGLLEEPLTPLVDRLRSDSPDVALVVHQGPAPERHLSAATREMLRVAELDPEQAALGLAGVWLFGPHALGRVAQVWRDGREVDLTVVADTVVSAGGNFDVLFVDAWSRYAGDPLDLLELNRIALDRIETGRSHPVNNGNRIEGRVRIHEDARVSSSVIVGPTVIGAEARISDAYIGPYTSIGDGARIDGAEIERSIICAGASITHVGGRLVASVVGRDARVFRDFSLPRALRLRVGDGTVVALC